APAVMDTFKAPGAMKLSDLPIIGDRLFRLIAPYVIISKSADELGIATEKEKDRYIRRFADFARYKGYFRALASSLAHCILDYDTAMEAYRATAASGKPMLVIWGTEDHTMPYYQIDRMKEVCPDACYVTYKDARHMFVYDEAERTAWDIVEWMNDIPKN
ncbi:MAG: alpha/beta fold hydrolase, partial [Lachnospiraceae bacterium]|nr:alpha/beta fold hydrolase [Lachnospiraceae bacterium]